MKLRKILATVMTVVMAASLAACGNPVSTSTSKSSEPTSASKSTSGSKSDSASNSAASDKTYKIGVIQLAPHAALDAANKGFFKALDELGIKYEADQKNAGGEQNACQTIAETLVNSGSDLIFAIATPAAQAVAGATSEIPIVLTAVTDPADSGLVADNKAPGGNVTGTSDLTPVAEQIALIKKINPDAKKVGFLYCSAEANSEFQISLAKEACEKEGLEYEDFSISSTNEIQTVVESAVGKVDVLYSPTDNMVANAMSTVAMIANENKLPVICGEEGMVDNGGLITYGINYEELGYKAGQMAAKILTGESKPAEMPIEYLEKEQCSLKINEDTSKALGLDLSALKAE